MICSGPDQRWDNFRDNLGYILRYSRKVESEQSHSATRALLDRLLPGANAVRGRGVPDLCAGGRTFTVDLSAMPQSRKLAVEWFNPSTGAATAGQSIAAGSTRNRSPRPLRVTLCFTWWIPPDTPREGIDNLVPKWGAAAVLSGQVRELVRHLDQLQHLIHFHFDAA